MSTSVPALAGDQRLLDFTWITVHKGWALAAKRCGAPTCTQLFSTADGGRNWSPRTLGRTKPATVSGCDRFSCVDHVRFVSNDVAYLWGNVGGSGWLFMSVDAGLTWTAAQTPQLLSLEPAGDAVVRVVAPQGLPAPARVERAAVGSTQWTTIDVGATGSFGAVVIPTPSAVYIAFPGHTAGGAYDAHTSFVRSTDRGRSWSRFPDPCGETAQLELDAVVAAAGPAGTFGVICSPRGGSADSILLSADMGIHFGPSRSLPETGEGPVQIGLPSPGDVVVAISGGGSRPSSVFWSGDGGRQWLRALSAPSAVAEGAVSMPWLGFETAQVGRVSFGSTLWTSEDAGRSWRSSTLP